MTVQLRMGVGEAAAERAVFGKEREGGAGEAELDEEAERVYNDNQSIY